MGSIFRSIRTMFPGGFSSLPVTMKHHGVHTTKFGLNSCGVIKGEVFEKMPIKVRCEKGETYNWCACGRSKKQPFCDGSHQQSTKGLKPVTFVPPESKDYMLCNCKQTNLRPFCDGSHKKSC